MTLSGGLAIWAAASLGWGAVNILLGLVYLPLVLVTWRSPEPEEPAAGPKTLRDAIWLPFLECLSRHRAVEILVFVVLYKLADALSQSLLRPFLIDMGYGGFDRGFVLGTAGVALTIAGTFLGGIACTRIGLGHSLWIFGFFQVFSNIGYVLITYWPGGRPVMYGAMAFEMVTSGLGMGAFGVLLLRITEKRFSATQYALFSSLFGLPRILGGPITGLIVDAAGWRTFFWFTIVAGVPGLILLQRFAPLGVREPRFTAETVEVRRRMTGRQIAAARGGRRGRHGDRRRRLDDRARRDQGVPGERRPPASTSAPRPRPSSSRSRSEAGRSSSPSWSSGSSAGSAPPRSSPRATGRGQSPPPPLPPPDARRRAWGDRLTTAAGLLAYRK